MIFPSYQYVNLENSEIFELAQNDINEFLNLFKAPLIIDVSSTAETLNMKATV